MLDNEFKLSNNHDVYKSNHNNMRQKSIIKNNSLTVGQPTKIEPFDFSNGHLHQSSVSPIEENGEIKGFVFECGCGEVIEVLLEYNNLSKVS